MKMKPKEILKTKSDKMIDLIIDELEPDTEKEITAGFTKNNIKYILTVKIEQRETNKPQIPTQLIDEEDDI